MADSPESGLRARRAWCLALAVLLGLPWLGCPARETPPSPRAAAFRQEMREIIDKLTAVLAEPLCRNDVRACEEAISSLYPETSRDSVTFPFRLGIINREGVLIHSIPPGRTPGEDYSQYQAVRQALRGRRITNARLYAPDGKEVYLILAPIFKNRQLAGLLVLRLDPALVQQRWGLGEEEFLNVDLN